MWTIVDANELAKLRHMEKMVRYYCATEEDAVKTKKPKPQDFTLVPHFSTSCDSRELVLLRELAVTEQNFHHFSGQELVDLEDQLLNELTEVRNGFRA